VEAAALAGAEPGMGVPGGQCKGRRSALVSVRHAKSNGIDADTLARLPLIAPEGLQPLDRPGPEVAALDRRVRACDRLTPTPRTPVKAGP
jgi:hypothetical protein